MMKLKCGSNFFNGVQALNFIHGFRRFLRYSKSSSSSTEAIPSSSLTNYLVEVLGFSSQQSLSTSTKLARRRKSANAKNVSTDWCNWACNADLVTNFFKQNGFDESQIRKIISVQPRILLSNVDKTLIPKFELLREIGFSESDLSRSVANRPVMLCMHLNPLIQNLRQVLNSDENVRKSLSSSSVCSRGSWINNHNNLISNVELLEKYGIPYDIIQKHVMQCLDAFFLRPITFENLLIKVEHKFGISRDSTMFLYAVRILRNYSEQIIESKFQVYKSFGWTRSDFMELIRRIPSCLGLSEAMTKRKLSFFMNELGYQPAFLMSRSAFMTCSLEKRVMPRYQVFLVLKEKGLIKKNYSFYHTVLMSESKFVNNLVLPYVEVHEIYANHVGVNAKLLTQGKAKSSFQHMNQDSDATG